ncbi:zinc knuckle protein (macronuclear) [Tetrahymena thermophila SB210]|uniref:Zinc knuckle protein n=1 Tax=Tetrahymena thermophila (strain SB210) TaxID=312017 RepID=Q22WR4_TETTS|nr:zinc knuckle protein [Tetrahymena thermophila SB210]EAR89728.2 zinc knuckle protein [Tetrahymena thermophila SB210]|eukprot:XP_001009973.2 zinc knuckle protein [Tetrahymena thermophila SB210]
MKSSQQYFNLSDNSDNERYSKKRNKSGHQQDQKASKQGKGERKSYQSFNQFQQLMESPNAYLALSDSSGDERSSSKRMASRYKKISKQSSKGTKEQYEKQKSQNHHNHHNHHTHHKDIQESHDHKSHQKKQDHQHQHQHQHHSHRKSSNDGKAEQIVNIISNLENQVKTQQETFKESSIQYSSNHQIQKSPSDSTSTNIDDVSEQPQKINYTLHLNAFNSVLTPEEMKNLTFEDSRHYKVIGDTRIFYTRSGNLSQKIKEIHNTKEEQERLAFLEEKRKQQELLKNISENKSSETNKEEKMDDEQEENFRDLFEYDKNNRYFQQEQKPQMTCRRCKQQGHFERMCMLEVKDVCNNCLGDHFARQCQQKICYSCSQFGHASANCPKQNQQKCSRCQKPGHIKADCGAIFMNSYSKYKQNTPFNGIEEEWKKTDDQKIKCMVCHKKGHSNCKNDYQKIKDDIYGTKFQERIQKLRRKEEEAKFQGKIINFHYSDESEDSYDSHLAPPSPALSSQSQEERNEKKRNSKKKQKRQQDSHHHNSHSHHSHSSHSHSKHHGHHHSQNGSHHSQHSSHRHHHSHHDENHHHHHRDSHHHHKSDKYSRYYEDIQIHVDDDKHYKLKKQIRKESKKYK